MNIYEWHPNNFKLTDIFNSNLLRLCVFKTETLLKMVSETVSSIISTESNLFERQWRVSHSWSLITMLDHACLLKLFIQPTLEVSTIWRLTKCFAFTRPPETIRYLYKAQVKTKDVHYFKDYDSFFFVSHKETFLRNHIRHLSNIG